MGNDTLALRMVSPVSGLDGNAMQEHPLNVVCITSLLSSQNSTGYLQSNHERLLTFTASRFGNGSQVMVFLLVNAVKFKDLGAAKEIKLEVE